jgi:uncharacterized protein
MRLATILIPLALSTFLASPALAQTGPSLPTIAVDGRGEVSASPDTAYINSGVTTQAATAREALDANTAAMTQLIDTLKAAGIAERDIQTSGFSVSPNYVYSDLRDALGYSQPPKINGYTVSNTVNVRVRDIGILGDVLDKSVSVGANTINGISFAVDDPADLYNEARKLAFADARAKASLYADAADVDLKSIRSLSESQGYAPPQPYMMREAAVASDKAVPIQSGELTFSINVQVTWEIGD